MLRTSFFIWTILILINVAAFGQHGYVNNGIVLEKDTISNIKLPTYYVVSPRKFKTKKQEIKYTRLVRYVKTVYPYAKLAGEKLQKYDSILRATPNERERRKIMKKAEEELRNEYEGKLVKLTITQGKILVKLIDRETNHSSYNLLKELRGGVNAVLWQGIGRIFGYNLKVKYDPKGEDYQIEQIVQLIEMGAI
jgi:hypothetical protein